MKVKKIFVGGLVLVFAIGSAIASGFAPAQPHVKGKTSINPDVWQCVLIDTEFCDTQGTFECRINIPVNGIRTYVLAYKGPGLVSPEIECTIPLRQDAHAPVASTPIVTILEVWYTDLR